MRTALHSPRILSLSLQSIAHIRGRYWSAKIDDISLCDPLGSSLFKSRRDHVYETLFDELQTTKNPKKAHTVTCKRTKHTNQAYNL
jgi:hypothetical protein